MAAASKMYVKGMFQRFSYLAAWLPNTTLRLGDVGLQRGQEFKQMTTLGDLGISFRVRTGASPVDFTYTSQSGVSVKPKVAAQAGAGAMLPSAQAGISIEFSEDGAFLFHAVGCSVDEIEDKEALGRAVIAAIKAGNWNSDWGVVDTLVRADSATIVVSNSHKAALELSAKAPVAPANLASLDAGLSVSSQSGDIIQFIAAKGLAPLFRLSRAKQSLLASLLGSSGAITFGGSGGEAAGEPVPEGDVFEAVAPD
jgi:hypothetical protein